MLKRTIKALTVLVGRLSLSVGWENGPERRPKTVSFNPQLFVILVYSADPRKQSTHKSEYALLLDATKSKGMDTPLKGRRIK